MGLGTGQLLAYRFTGAALLLWAVALVIRRPLPPRRALIGLVLLGAVGYVGQSGTYFTALRYIPASTTALLLYTYPVAVTLLAALLFAEPLSRSKLIAMGLALLGTALVVRAQLNGAAPIGIALGLSAAAVYSGYILAGSRILPGIAPLTAAATIMSSAALVFIGVTAGTGGLGIDWTLSRLALIGAFVVLGTAIPVLAFVSGLALIGASRAAILSTFEPASTVLLAVLFLGERASPLQYAGGALILLSVIALEGRGFNPARVLPQATRE
jgi:drug/metabolite transporter (DMT)-like permease